MGSTKLFGVRKTEVYFSVKVHQIVTDGEELTAWQYYQCLHRLFLRMGREMAAFKYVEGKKYLYGWLD